MFLNYGLFYSRLPYWVQAIIPKIFYVTEKAWNYYPFTITDYTVSEVKTCILPKTNGWNFCSVPLFQGFTYPYKPNMKTIVEQLTM